MNFKLVTSLLLALSSVTVCAVNAMADSPKKTPADTPVSISASHADFCFFAGAPPSNVQYSLIKDVKLGKATYGSARQLLDAFVERARSLGADAVINYSGAQHFGFFPWRMVHPVVRGSAIKWLQSKPDCKAIGGSTIVEMMESGKSPGT